MVQRFAAPRRNGSTHHSRRRPCGGAARGEPRNLSGRGGPRRASQPVAHLIQLLLPLVLLRRARRGHGAAAQRARECLQVVFEVDYAPVEMHRLQRLAA
jgi:hypothetical protein